jgi:hypothetical protein
MTDVDQAGATSSVTTPLYPGDSQTDEIKWPHVEWDIYHLAAVKTNSVVVLLLTGTRFFLTPLLVILLEIGSNF